ncbi:UNVERIFIED_CONTAM: Retrovirus-related Pol polyprotein from transposon TNT 1-94 [Sesamum radiatum]|uniref:Retrovirus-related Pol polyprotein from transposon TNT 1-94 n=1 Tax=Sesamum radiatum TaxID=300843 RepID=A0AAW2TJF6_SESRA
MQGTVSCKGFFSQIEGVDYVDCFLPVAKAVTSPHGHCLFAKGSGDDYIALLVYVDDVLVTSPSSVLITEAKAYLDKLFTIKDLGLARYFLGLQIARSSAGTNLTQAKYIQDILQDTGLQHAKAATTPLPQGTKLCATEGVVLSGPEHYKRLLQAYCDADWASCLDSRRLVTGFCVFLGMLSSLGRLRSKPPSPVLRPKLSTGVWHLLSVSYNGFPVSSPIPMFCDNKAALHIMANPIFHENTKHLDIDCHIVCNQYKLDFVASSFVRSKEQLADLFTKSLPGPLFLDLLSKLHLFSLIPSPACWGCDGILPSHSCTLLCHAIVTMDSAEEEEVCFLINGIVRF